MDKEYGADKKQQKELIATVTVEPGDTVLVDIGIYEGTIPQPIIGLRYETTSHTSIETALQRTDAPGEYSLHYSIKNSGDSFCTVHIWED